MVVHDPLAHSPYAAEKDPRLTAVGALLRRLHFDELPQLLNILAGEMSLVGPRAEWTVLSQEYRKQIPHYDARHAVRPGVTGWAQVCYPYGRSVEDAVEKLRFDFFYIKHYSLFLDAVILARTVKTVIGVEGNGRVEGSRGSGGSKRPDAPPAPGYSG
jgi:lipopolysaccharide/colanic/teichoic acid biosynthesis glycosyltransferase